VVGAGIVSRPAPGSACQALVAAERQARAAALAALREELEAARGLPGGVIEGCGHDLMFVWLTAPHRWATTGR